MLTHRLPRIVCTEQCVLSNASEANFAAYVPWTFIRHDVRCHTGSKRIASALSEAFLRISQTRDECARRDSGELGQLRNQITQMLFKHLTSSDKAAVAHAQEGLAAIISHQKMPKQLLQTSLRPILVNLAYYNKLRLPLLHGLERLLQLLASWFNVTLGIPTACQSVHTLISHPLKEIKN